MTEPSCLIWASCLPATSCLLVILSHSLPEGRWEAQEGVRMTDVDTGPTPACTHHPACPPSLLSPPGSTPSCWITVEQHANGSWQPAWLTACGHAKCTDFHILMLRSEVIWTHLYYYNITWGNIFTKRLLSLKEYFDAKTFLLFQSFRYFYTLPLITRVLLQPLGPNISYILFIVCLPKLWSYPNYLFRYLIL